MWAHTPCPLLKEGTWVESDAGSMPGLGVAPIPSRRSPCSPPPHGKGASGSQAPACCLAVLVSALWPSDAAPPCVGMGSGEFSVDCYVLLHFISLSSWMQESRPKT